MAVFAMLTVSGGRMGTEPMRIASLSYVLWVSHARTTGASEAQPGAT